MKQIFKGLFITILFVTLTPNVKASSCSVTASSRSVTVGSTVTIRVKGNDAIGRFNASSSNSAVLSGGGAVWIENSSSSISFKALKTGTSTINVLAQSGLSNNNGDEISVGCNSVTITVKSKTTSNSSTTSKHSTTTTSTKSSDNNLKSLSIDGIELAPKFDKNTTTYSMTVPNETSKIKINAEKNNSKASISGSGEKDLKEGTNKFEVVVTAENGSKKTYTINITVDSKPIIVTIDAKEYSLIKKKEELPELKSEHSDLTLTIEEQEIPAYRVEKTNYILVGLKDSEGNVNFYKFDSKKNEPDSMTYTLYKELNFNGVNITILDMDESLIPDTYNKYETNINEQKIEVYKFKKDSNYSLIYGLNIETGEKNIYMYDSKENTLQIYNREEIKNLEEKQEQYEKFILILGGVIIFLILLVTVGFTRKPKVKEKKNITEKVKATLLEDDNEELSKKEIKKIKKSNKKQNKENKKKLKKGELDM